jgi:hypothetical protein
VLAPAPVRAVQVEVKARKPDEDAEMKVGEAQEEAEEKVAATAEAIRSKRRRAVKGPLVAAR